MGKALFIIGAHMRTLLAAILFSATLPVFAQTVGSPESPARPLLELTDTLWVSNWKLFTSTLGEYKRCGAYVFTYTPHAKPNPNPVVMVGVVYPNPSPGIGQSVVGETILRKNTQVQLLPLPKDAVSASKDVSATDKERPLAILLPKKELAHVGTCTGIPVPAKKK